MMPKKSAVMTNPYRKEIEEMIIEGKSSRQISDWLKDHDESISHTAINNYRKNDYNIKEEAVKEYNKKQSSALKSDAVEKTVSEIEYCDDIINAAAKIGIKIDPKQGISNLDIKKLGLQAVKIKHAITKDEPTPIIGAKVEEVDEEERQLIKEFGDYLARRGPQYNYTRTVRNKTKN
jgi:DNA-binding CsgD family transcriptional regulator